MSLAMKWRPQRRHDHFSDVECVEAYRSSSDMQALGILFDRYVELIFGVCLKYLKDARESEDAAMEIFEVLRVKLRSHEVAVFRSWLYVLTRNHCLQILRRRQTGLTEIYDGNVMQSEPQEHPPDELFHQRRENGLRSCLDKLPEAQKQSIELFYFESKSYQEIAEILTVDKEQVRSHLQNGRRNLKNCMDKHDED
jgi:RNA polymerase sigma-70 factor (ECF subfamily)